MTNNNIIVEGSSKGRSAKVIATLIAIALCVPFALFGCSSESNSSAQTAQSNPQNGQAPYKSDEEMQEELDRKVEEGMLDISIASKIVFENGTSEGTANIENVPGNIYDQKVIINLEDTDEQIYESPLLKPNQFIEKIKLSRDLDPGEYSAVANFVAYNQETGEEEGAAAAIIDIVVEN